jgi:hypothetical protein
VLPHFTVNLARLGLSHLLPQGESMLRLMLFVVILASTSACAERRTTSYTLFDGRLETTVPADYVLHEKRSDYRRRAVAENPVDPEFILFGGNAALARKFPEHSYPSDFIDGFAGEDVQARLGILLVDLIPSEGSGEWYRQGDSLAVPPDATARAIHEAFCERFTQQWTEYSFAYFDPETGIGRCINFAGAFVAIFTRRLDNTLLLVSGSDAVEVLILQKNGPGKAVPSMTDEEKWRVYRAAANAEAAEQVLLSARLR